MFNIVFILGIQHNHLIYVCIVKWLPWKVQLISITSHSYIFSCDKNFYNLLSFNNFQIYNTVLLMIVTMLYVTSPILITGSLHLVTPSPILTTPSSSTCGKHLSVACIYSIWVFLLVSTCKWSYTICVSLWLTSLSIITLKVHPCCHKWQRHHNGLNNIVLYVYINMYTTFSLSIHSLMDT